MTYFDEIWYMYFYTSEILSTSIIVWNRFLRKSKTEIEICGENKLSLLLQKFFYKKMCISSFHLFWNTT